MGFKFKKGLRMGYIGGKWIYGVGLLFIGFCQGEKLDGTVFMAARAEF